MSETVGGACFLYGTRTAIVFTALAMSLCTFSLALPMFSMSYYNEVEILDQVYVTDETFVFYHDYLNVEDRAYLPYSDSPVGDLMDEMTVMVIVWVIVGVVYIGSCVIGSRALIRGFLLLFCSVLPVVYFVARMPYAISEWGYLPYHLFAPGDFWGYISSHPYDGSTRSWGPMLGWYLLLLACILQSAAIIRRNAPMVAAIVNIRRAGPAARSAEDLSKGSDSE